jgi:hypothetical protein
VRRWCIRGVVTVRDDLYRLTPLIAFFGIYWIFSLTSHLNIGHRHILPIYPVIFIATGALGAWVYPQRTKIAAVAIALLGWHVGEAIAITPHYIAYFNEAAGGPKNGRFHLVDSSLDWGQDLPGLKQWLAKNNPGNDPVFLSYFGTGEPAYYGLRVHRTAFINNFKFPIGYVPLEPGIYCISATSLAQVYNPFRGPWTIEFEKEYQALRTLAPTPGQPQAVIRRHDLLRFARLCHYLRVRQPDDNIGYSIWIFRLNADEIAQTTSGSLADWSGLIERTAATH